MKLAHDLVIPAGTEFEKAGVICEAQYHMGPADTEPIYVIIPTYLMQGLVDPDDWQPENTIVERLQFLMEAYETVKHCVEVDIAP